MVCIFCKQSSHASNSVEHIVPESLGNKNNILPKGVVCDFCNNYFAVKIEKEVLQSPFFLSLRGRNTIENKKGKTPWLPAFIRHPELLGELNARFHNDIIEVTCADEGLFNDIISSKYSKLYLPYIAEPSLDDVVLSRFLAKVAIEAFVQRLMQIDGWESQYFQSEAIEELSAYARYGKGDFWPYYQRRIYSEDEVLFESETNEAYQILHEYDFFIPERPHVEGEIHHMADIYFVCAIMGIEYTINLTRGGLDKYIQWLEKSNQRSILKMNKEEFNPYTL